MAKAEEAEILVVGAGMVGLTFATALADAGLALMVIDHMDPAAFRDEAFDGRSSSPLFWLRGGLPIAPAVAESMFPQRPGSANLFFPAAPGENTLRAYSRKIQTE